MKVKLPMFALIPSSSKFDIEIDNPSSEIFEQFAREAEDLARQYQAFATREFARARLLRESAISALEKETSNRETETREVEKASSVESNISADVDERPSMPT